MTDLIQNRVILAPLNWGLGHAARCIPIAEALLDHGFEPVLAGDGPSLELLRREFPSLRSYQLPAYKIRYARNAKNFKRKMMAQGAAIVKTALLEQAKMEEIVKKEKACGVISDNRFGARSKRVPSVFITHQLKVKSGWTTSLTSSLHQKVIAQFDQCWVCDHMGSDALSGELSSQVEKLNSVKWIGPLSRFKAPKEPGKKEIDLLFVLSGPEPSRTDFEQKILAKYADRDLKIVLIQGLVEARQKWTNVSGIDVCNFMLSDELNETLLKAERIVSRSGYSSVMDMDKLGARALFVPTPGQNEQEYLALYLSKQGRYPYVEQSQLQEVDLIEKLDAFQGQWPRDKEKTPRLDAALFDLFGGV